MYKSKPFHCLKIIIRLLYFIWVRSSKVWGWVFWLLFKQPTARAREVPARNSVQLILTITSRRQGICLSSDYLESSESQTGVAKRSPGFMRISATLATKLTIRSYFGNTALIKVSIRQIKFEAIHSNTK